MSVVNLPLSLMRHLAITFLNDLSEVHGNAGSNDFDLKAIVPDVTQRVELMRVFHNLNGDPESFEADVASGRTFDTVHDSCLLAIVQEWMKRIMDVRHSSLVPPSKRNMGTENFDGVNFLVDTQVRMSCLMRDKGVDNAEMARRLDMTERQVHNLLETTSRMTVSMLGRMFSVLDEVGEVTSPGVARMLNEPWEAEAWARTQAMFGSGTEGISV